MDGTMKKLMRYITLAAGLAATACQTPTIKQETETPVSKQYWQPIFLQPGEEFSYQTVDANNNTARIDLEVRRQEPSQLQASWLIKPTNAHQINKQITSTPDLLLISSHAALIKEKSTTPFLNTVLMSWWSKIDYIRWEVGFKRAIHVEMLAGFMVEVSARCQTAGIQGYQVALKSGDDLMAEACIAPNIALPLSVTRYNPISHAISSETQLLTYQKYN